MEGRSPPATTTHHYSDPRDAPTMSASTVPLRASLRCKAPKTRRLGRDVQRMGCCKRTPLGGSWSCSFDVVLGPNELIFHCSGATNRQLTESA
jgi:hypothetical protein